MNRPGSTFRLFSMFTVKEGGPMEWGSGPASVERGRAFAGATASLSGAAVGSAKAASRRKKRGRPA
jgi:hypothetical protein